MRAQSAHSELCEHLPSQELRRAIEIGMKVQKDIADNLPCYFGDHARAACALAYEVRRASFASTVT